MIYVVMDSDIFFKIIDKGIAEELEIAIGMANMIDLEVDVKKKKIAYTTVHNGFSHTNWYEEECLCFGDKHYVNFEVALSGHLRKITILHKSIEVESFHFTQLKNGIIRLRELLIEEVNLSECRQT